MSAYAELAVTTNFSFLRGASHPDELVATAAALNLFAIGIADRNSFAGVVRAYDEARNHNIKLVVGVRLATVDLVGSLHNGRLDAAGTFRNGRSASLNWHRNERP